MDPSFEPRIHCPRCTRPVVVCFCAHVPSLETRTRVLIVQHPREEDVAIGTARMASMCLPASELVVGTNLDRDPTVRAALDDPERPAILLWPGPGARDLEADPPAGPVTLVVVDGTWALAKKLVKINPRLGALPRYAFAPEVPSRYRIRREPRAECVSTIEAVMYALGTLEGDRARFAAMLKPFEAMVDMQLAHQARFGSGRHRKRLPRAERQRRVPEAFGERERMVVISGEGNAWPRGHEGAPKDELVHWLAVRVATGERFEAVVRPRGAIAPSTPRHTRLALEAIEAGLTREAMQAAWRAFVRDDDVVVGWGHYAATRMRDEGGALGGRYLDLRSATARHIRGKPGTIDEFVERVGASPPPLGAGRGGVRLAATVAILDALVGGTLPAG